MVLKTLLFGFGSPTPCICTETNSMMEATQYGTELTQQFLNKIEQDMFILNQKLKIYNDVLEDNVKTQRKWTSLMMAEMAEKKKKIQDLRAERYLRCRNVDAEILVIRSKLEQLELLLQQIREKFNLKLSKELEKNIDEIQFLR